MIYKITQITLCRKHKNRPDEFYTYNVQEETKNLKAYKDELVEKYQATEVDLTHTLEDA